MPITDQLQQAKISNIRIVVTTTRETICGRVRDLDSSNLYMVTDAGEQRYVNVGSVVSVA